MATTPDKITDANLAGAAPVSETEMHLVQAVVTNVDPMLTQIELAEGTQETHQSILKENKTKEEIDQSQQMIADLEKVIKSMDGQKEEKDEQVFLTHEQWDKRENELLQRITVLEKQKINTNIESLKTKLRVREEENDLLKHKVRSLGTELKAILNNPDSSYKNKELAADIKKQHDQLLAKAKNMIFDKTKIMRNQELQIKALTGQVSSLKEVVGITKDLLGIRNMEVKHLKERLDTTEVNIKAERERQKLLMSRVDTGMKKNEELRAEYSNQLSLFKDLQVKYEKRMHDLRNENKNLSEQIEELTKKI